MGAKNSKSTDKKTLESVNAELEMYERFLNSYNMPKKSSNFGNPQVDYQQIDFLTRKVNELRETKQNLEIAIQNKKKQPPKTVPFSRTHGGKPIKYKKTENKVQIKNQTRCIYTNKGHKYVKMNGKYVLLSKAKSQK